MFTLTATPLVDAEPNVTEDFPTQDSAVTELVDWANLEEWNLRDHPEGGWIASDSAGIDLYAILIHAARNQKG